MTIRFEGDEIVMSGVCAIEEIEELMGFLEQHKQAHVNLAQCEHMHTALLQLLMQYHVKVRGTAYTPFLWKWVVPVLGVGGD
jgi:sialic acid synthase SpsE